MSEDEIDRLIRQLFDILPREQWDAAEALGRIGDVCSVPALVDALKQYSEGYCFVKKEFLGMKFVEALGKIAKKNSGNPELIKAVPALIDALKDEKAKVRGGAAWALYDIISDSNKTFLREAEEPFRKALEKAEGNEEKEILFGLLNKINNRKNTLLEPEAKKLKPPKRIRRKPKRRLWRAAQRS